MVGYKVLSVHVYTGLRRFLRRSPGQGAASAICPCRGGGLLFALPAFAARRKTATDNNLVCAYSKATRGHIDVVIDLV